MMLDTTKPFVFVCKHHNRRLVEGGHSVGMGVESFPGFSIATTREGECIFYVDTSELACPGWVEPEDRRDDETKEQFYARYDAEVAKCQDSWEPLQITEEEAKAKGGAL